MGGKWLAPAMAAPLSDIATSTAHGEDSPYFAGWRAYDDDPYDPITNPSGVIQMGLAENQVSFDLLEKYLMEHPAEASCFRENALFQDYHGLKAFRKAMASFMEQIRGGRARFDPDRIVLTAGATAANELLTFILANPGDALLIPTPYYPGDLRWRTGVHIVPVHCSSANGFQVTRRALDEAHAAAAAAGVRVKGVLLTNPSNPLGTAVQRAVLEEVLDFAARNNIHLISDEIYSGSVFAPPEFVSVAELVEQRRCRGEGGDVAGRVHIVYSLSKDLGLPGFRVGTIYSYNDAVVAAARRMSSFTLVSSQTQQALSAMLSDAAFAGGYIRSNRVRLRERHARVVAGLGDAGIACLAGGNAGLFVWVDLRPLLPEQTVAGELTLWEALLREAKLNISPGSSCHCSEPGWFRLCFANMSLSTLEVALARLSGFMAAKNTSDGAAEQFL